MDKNFSIVTSDMVKKITKKFKVNKIILFGSYAYGTPTDESDIDLCIITDENKRKIELMREIRTTLKGIKYPLDILVYKKDEFDYRADSNTSLENYISRQGIVLYE
jgi:uncharacterized protein